MHRLSIFPSSRPDGHLKGKTGTGLRFADSPTRRATLKPAGG
jgi:hypothetical protein